MKTAYLTGYTGKPTRTPAQLKQLAINLGAVVVDARYSPRSRVAHWNKEALQLALQGRYLWLQGFGRGDGAFVRRTDYDGGATGQWRWA